MKTNIIRIGNSQGIRIPKVLLEESRLGPEVELEVADNTIVIRALAGHRQGWEEKFRLMAERSDDRLFDGDVDVANEWDRDEWTW